VPTFSARSNLVIVRVVVRDKDGRANGSLQKEDFQLFDKGKLQFISRFSIEKGEGRKAGAAPGEGADQAKPSVGEPVAPERYTAYVFDDVHLRIGDLAQVRQAAEHHLQEAPATTRSAIYTTSGRTTQDFTDDFNKLRDTLRRILPSPITAPAGTDCPDLTYYQADLIQNKNDPQALQAAVADTILCAHLDPQDTSTPAVAQSMAQAGAARMISMGEMETLMSLRVLGDVARRMSAMPGQRSIILVSPGFLVLDDHRFEEIQVMERALRSNVVISSLDARGLYTVIPGGDASQSGGNLGTMGLRSQYQIASAAQEEDVMAELAAGTGGNFFHNSNDLEGGFKRIASPPEFYYVLGFTPENLKFDGSYHNLKVSLAKNFKGFTVLARRGYFAPKHEENAAEGAKREVEEALFSRDEWHDIPVNLETQFFKASDEKAKLSILARVDVRQLRFQKADGRNMDKLTVVSGIFDRNGNFISGMEKTVDMRLKDDTLAHRLDHGITVRSGFDVTPGSYFVRLVVRDSEGQRMAALNGAVEIP
jgi:VWFA-related protein